jgi:hypothetical protein
VVRHYPIVLGFILFAQATSALAHGAVVAFEKPNGTADIVYSFNDRTEQEADNQAHQLCISRNGNDSAKSCLTIYRFHDMCIGVARRGPHSYFAYFAPTSELAKAQALHNCLAPAGSPQKCNEPGTNFALCDTTPASLTTASNQTFDSRPDIPDAIVLLAALLLVSAYWPAVKMRRRPKAIAIANTPSAASFEHNEVPSTTAFAEVGPADAIAAESSTRSNAEPASTLPLAELASQLEPIVKAEPSLAPPEQPPAASDTPAPERLDPPPAPEATSPAVDPTPTVQQEEKSQPLEKAPELSTESMEAVDPLEGMVLKMKRSTKDGLLGRVTYMIDARLDASTAIRATIAKHRLGRRVIYESAARLKHHEHAQDHLADSYDNTSIFAPGRDQIKGFAKTFWQLGRAGVSATRAALSLRITVDKLLSGVHVECKSIDELQEAETALLAAKSNLEAYIEKLGTFDGREEIH